MKNLLVTAATEAEIAPFIRFLEEHYQKTNHNVFQNEYWSIKILISGVGMMAAAFSLGKEFASKKYDGALQAGIAGSFNFSIPLGTLATIISEQYGDLGAEDNERYIGIFELGFLDKNIFPFTDGKLVNNQPLKLGETLPALSAMSINTVSGSAETIAERKLLHPTDLESMEGIAFHYACLQNAIPFIQIRAISNYVTPRNKADWNIKLAIDNLNNYLQHSFSTKQSER